MSEALKLAAEAWARKAAARSEEKMMSEALKLADALRDGTYLLSQERDTTEAALRSQHAEIEHLRAEWDALLVALEHAIEYATEYGPRLSSRGEHAGAAVPVQKIRAAIDAAKGKR